MKPFRLARRAQRLPATLPASHFPTEIDATTVLFDSGFAFPGLFPELGEIARRAVTEHRDETLQYAPAQGQPELRRWIADYMNGDGCLLDADNILITNGAKHAIDLTCRLLVDEGDAIVVTAPMYFTAIPIFRSFGVRFIEVEQDECGIRVDELAKLIENMRRAGDPLPKLIYNVADFHNPSGVTMTLERRRALVELAAEHGICIAEDTPYRRVRFEGADVASLKALDPGGVVLHLGTFSKLISPGLRMGWVAAEKELIARMIGLKSEGGSSPLLQRIIYEFLRSDRFPGHITRVQQTYREHRDHLIACLKRELPDLEFIVPQGGYYVWLRLPAAVDGDELARRAAAAGVNLIPGSRFFAGDAVRHGRNHIRLSYSFATLDQIGTGIKRLAAAYAECSAKQASA